MWQKITAYLSSMQNKVIYILLSVILFLATTFSFYVLWNSRSYYKNELQNRNFTIANLNNLLLQKQTALLKAEQISSTAVKETLDTNNLIKENDKNEEIKAWNNTFIPDIYVKRLFR